VERPQGRGGPLDQEVLGFGGVRKTAVLFRQEAGGYEPMVLVSYIPYSHISLLQTKFSNREGHELSVVRDH
jgi:hypothetical protein